MTSQALPITTARRPMPGSGLARADSIVHATALQVRGVVWTQDADFRELPGVEYRAHRKSRGI